MISVGEALVIKKRREFVNVSNTGARFFYKSFILQGCCGGGKTRVGFIATKKLGGAVIRNRAKRRLREAVKTVINRDFVEKHNSCDYVFVARKFILEQPFVDLVNDVRNGLNKC